MQPRLFQGCLGKIKPAQRGFALGIVLRIHAHYLLLWCLVVFLVRFLRLRRWLRGRPLLLWAVDFLNSDHAANVLFP